MLHRKYFRCTYALQLNETEMITTDWNNDLEDDQLIPESMREDDDTEREDQDEEEEPLWRSDEDYGKER